MIMKLRPLLLACSAAPLLAVAALAADVSPAQPVIPDRTFNLHDFGAVADARTSNTEAFHRAVAAVSQAGGGTLVVPAGIFYTDSFELCSGINLHLDAGATILFSPHALPVAGRQSLRPLLLTSDAHDVMISGSGTINGSGEAWWPAMHASSHSHKPAAPRPHSMVGFENCVRVRIEGVTLTHSPEYNLVPERCQDVTIDGITIYNPADDIFSVEGVDPAEVRNRLQKEYDDESPNTDGIDPWVCQRVLITHCRIDTGDDCIAIKADRGAVSEDILITDCTFLHGHGCSIGSGTQGGLRNLVVRNSVFDGTHVGINFKSARDRGGLVDGVVFDHLTMEHVGEAFVITSYYPQIGPPIYYRPYQKQFSIDLANGGHTPAQPVTPLTPRWQNIAIRHITGTCVWEAGIIIGLPEMPVDGVTFDHINLTAPDGLRVSYAKNVTLHDVQIHALHAPAIMLSDTVTSVVQ